MIRTMKGGKSYSHINANSTKPSCKKVELEELFESWYKNATIKSLAHKLVKMNKKRKKKKEAR